MVPWITIAARGRAVSDRAVSEEEQTDDCVGEYDYPAHSMLRLGIRSRPGMEAQLKLY